MQRPRNIKSVKHITKLMKQKYTDRSISSIDDSIRRSCTNLGVSLTHKETEKYHRVSEVSHEVNEAEK